MPVKTDNRDLYYYTERDNAVGLEYEERLAINDTLLNKYDYYTVLNVIFESPPDLSGVSETDVIYEEGPVDDRWSAMYYCNDRAYYYDCDQGYVRFDYYTISDQTGLPCHDTGHAVGLVHGQDSSPAQSNSEPNIYCMRNPVLDETGLGGWHRYNINEHY